jgi:hypothetical protein
MMWPGVIWLRTDAIQQRFQTFAAHTLLKIFHGLHIPLHPNKFK